MEDLEAYIDQCFHRVTMGKPKRNRTEDSPGAVSSQGSDFTDILDSIDKKLSSVDARLSLVEVLHNEFKSLRESLEYSQKQVVELMAENKVLRGSVKSLTEGMKIKTLEKRSSISRLVV